MRSKSVITLLFLVVIVVMARTAMPVGKKKARQVQTDTMTLVKDTLKGTKVLRVEPDTTKMDSLQLAVYHHNKAVDDSIRLDSINRSKKNGIDAPVTYSGEDSLVYDARTKRAYIYGSAKVKYENMELNSDRIAMSMDSSLVHAVGTPDSMEKGGVRNKPVFTMGETTYESDTMSFNFKTKKGFINNVTTHQEEGYLSSEQSKRNDNGDIYLKHGRYTTCDAEHPDFYIALSRAKVRPNKDVVFGPAYLVVADVPLPLAIPYGFFPFSKSY